MKKRPFLATLVLAVALGTVGASPALGFIGPFPGPLYLHAVNCFDGTAPTATTPQQADSGPLNFAGGNPWSQIGSTWHGCGLASLLQGDLHVWLGLKNSDDQGTWFDIHADVVEGASTVTFDKRCVTGLTRNPALAQEVVAPDSPPVSGVTSVSIFVRIGTNPDDTLCGGHRNATGVRLYYDAVSRPSGIHL